MYWWSRHRLGMFLIVGGLGTRVCCTTLIAPATAFAAAATSHGSSSCGMSSVTQVTVTSSQSRASIRLSQTLGQLGTSLIITGAGWPGNTTITIDAYGYRIYDGAKQLVLG